MSCQVHLRLAHALFRKAAVQVASDALGPRQTAFPKLDNTPAIETPQGRKTRTYGPQVSFRRTTYFGVLF
jgi:hypothetical protein